MLLCRKEFYLYFMCATHFSLGPLRADIYWLISLNLPCHSGRPCRHGTSTQVMRPAESGRFLYSHLAVKCCRTPWVGDSTLGAHYVRVYLVWQVCECIWFVCCLCNCSHSFELPLSFGITSKNNVKYVEARTLIARVLSKAKWWGVKAHCQSMVSLTANKNCT